MDLDRPLLVVTPTLGRSPWLGRTVESVARFAGPACQHVLVAPTARLAELGKAYPDCVVIADRNARGVYAAINAGIEGAPECGWRWFTWINDDDELAPGFAGHLQRALEEARAHEGDVWHYGQVLLINGCDRPLGRLAVTRRPHDIALLAGDGISPLNQHGLLIPRSWLERLRPLREDLRICADVDFWLRAAAGGADFRFSPEVVAVFRLHEGQASADIGSHRAEFRRVVDAIAPERAPRSSRWAARLRFRLLNAGVYLGRLRRSGWRGGLSLLEHPSVKETRKR